MVDVQDVHLTGVQPICHSGVCQGSGIAIMRTDFELFQVAILLILCLLELAAVLQQWTIPGVPSTTQRENLEWPPGEGMGQHPERKNETGTIYKISKKCSELFIKSKKKAPGTIYKSSAEPIRNYL